MSKESRTKKTLLNARVNVICNFVGLLMAFLTRKYLLENLGLEFMGLSGTLQSVLGFLNIAELGVGIAISYVLYKPVHDDNKERIKEIISVLGYLYRFIGFFVLGGGVIVSVLLPWIFLGTTLPLWIVYLGFYAYLTSTLLTYFANYRIALLNADQKTYKYTGVSQTIKAIKILVQMGSAIYFQSLWLFLVIELLFSGLDAVIIQRVVRREYPWLSTEVAKGRQLLWQYPEIVRYIKQVFVHKIGSFVQFQTLPLFINGYLNLATVAFYGNYSILTEGAKAFIVGVLNSTSAGVGNLISEGNPSKIWHTFKQLLLVHFFVASIVATCIYYLINDFIAIWLGNESYVLRDGWVVLFLSTGLFFALARGAIDQFIQGYGLFSDLWAPLAEVALSILGSFVLGNVYGLPGLVLAPQIAFLIIIFGWKAYFLCSRGLKQPITKYLLYLILCVLVALATCWLSISLLDWLKVLLGLTQTWKGWFAQGVLYFFVNTVLTFIAYFVLFAEFRDVMFRFIKRSRVTQ